MHGWKKQTRQEGCKLKLLSPRVCLRQTRMLSGKYLPTRCRGCKSSCRVGFPLGDFANLVCRAPEGTKGPRLGGTRPRKRGSCFTSSRGSSWSAPKSRPRSSLSRHSGSRRKRNSASSIGQSTIIPLLFFYHLPDSLSAMSSMFPLHFTDADSAGS